jgi:hypothetical protein
MESARPESIDCLVVSGFEELGAGDPQAYTYRILLRDRFFLGHRFECEGFEAIFRAEEGILEFYNQDGVLLKTISLHGEVMRKAA